MPTKINKIYEKYHFFSTFAQEFMLIREELLHFIWKHRFLPPRQLKTDSGQPLEILDPGLHNTDAGPDFLNAKIKINKLVWVGSVELHLKSNDWYAHGHHRNPVFDSVILHVCLSGQGVIKNSKGEVIPQLFIEIPDYLKEKIGLMDIYKEPMPCFSIIPSIKPIVTRSWMERLLIERFENRATRFFRYLKVTQYNWTAVFFTCLARAFGFGKNSETFEEWALHLPFDYLIKQVDNLEEIEAVFLGTAGLLKEGSLPDHCWEKVNQAPYFLQLRQNYAFLKHKFALKETDAVKWKYLRTRPFNFPHLRLVQLAAIFHSCCYAITEILEGSCDFEKKMKGIQVSPFWLSLVCGKTEECTQKMEFSIQSIELLEMNCIIPLIYAVGKYKGDENQMQLAVEKCCSLKPESNHYITLWNSSGLEFKNAGDTQAILQLQKEYCEKKKCLQCRFGYEYLQEKRNINE